MAVIALKISPIASVCVQELASTFCESERPGLHIKAFRLGVIKLQKIKLCFLSFFLMVTFTFILVVCSKRHQCCIKYIKTENVQKANNCLNFNSYGSKYTLGY